MKRILQSTTLITSFATFSMFFGAGNVVFPLGIGQFAQDKNIFAIFGLLITSVGVPLIGLIAMTLFNGDYKKFFQRVGDVPGYLFAFFIMLLIGPFGASPRTVALSYATINFFYPGISLPLFSFFACLVIFVLAYKRAKIVDILGYFLTPFLLLSLSIIIIIGLVSAPDAAPMSDHDAFEMFLHGLTEGYQTMDLLATPFFSSVVIVCLQQYVEKNNAKRTIFLALKASCIAALMLAIIYVGFSFVAAFHSQALNGVAQEELISLVAQQMLGKFGGIIASIAVALACLTTAIALSSVFAEFLHKDICMDKISYGQALLITMIITFFVSTLNFHGIVTLLTPVLQIVYPSLIVLCVANLFYKLHHFKPIKWPVYTVLLISLILYFF